MSPANGVAPALRGLRSLFSIPLPKARLGWGDWLLAAVFFIAAVFLFTRHNDFPSFYHPDEPSKARQLIKSEFNFNHPLLLLQATRVITAVAKTPRGPQAVTEAGRLVSALFAAAAVACLVLVAIQLSGIWAGGIAGALLVTNHQLYELAHYMKEDTALVFGMAAFFLFFVRSWQTPTFGNFALLGVAAALATSGKYLGALVIPLAIFPLSAVKEFRLRHVAIFLGAFIAAMVAINFPMLESIRTFVGNFDREVGFVIHGHKGITRNSVPSGVYGKTFREATNPIIWVLLAAYFTSLLTHWRKVPAAEKVFALFPIFYVLLLSFSPKTNDRYFLPDTLFFCTLAAMGVMHLAHWHRFLSPALKVALAAGAIIFSVIQLKAEDASFQNDARKLLIDYVREHIPHDAVIVQDKRVNLPNRNDPRQADSPYFLEQPLEGKLFAADVGTIDQLRARGIKYVAVANGDYGRFFLSTHHAQTAGQADFNRRKAFYEELFAQGQVLWECKAGDQLYLQPAIKFYYLPPAPPAP